MATTSKQTAQETVELDGFEGHYADLDGTTVGFERYTAHQDMAPLFRGLPDDACQCPHSGYVIRGKVGFRYTDGTEETVEAGQAYVARPGHTPIFHPDTELVEFSPTGPFTATVEGVMANLSTPAP